MTTELKLIDNEGAGCSCCAAPTAPTHSTVKENAMLQQTVTATYTVSGMTCGHCVASVSEEVGALDGVTGVDVDLATGKVVVTSAGPLVEADVRAAVGEAGYTLVA